MLVTIVQQTVPAEQMLFYERVDNVPWDTLTILTLSLVLLAFTRLSSSHFLLDLGSILWKNSQIERIVGERYPLTNFASVLLVVNHVLCFTGLVILSATQLNYLTNGLAYLIAPLVPVVLMVGSWISLRIVGLLTGEWQSFRVLVYNNWILVHVSGVAMSLLLIFWVVRPQWNDYLIFSFISIFIGVNVFRIFRGFVHALRQSMKWYYIILYFCTLEILPVILLVLLVKHFGQL